MPEDTKWIKVGSDSGDFSIDVPADYGFFSDIDGFTVSKASETYRLSNVSFLNSLSGKTLFSVESYKSDKSVISVLNNQDDRMMKADGEGKSGSFKIQDVKIKSRNFKNEKYFWTRWYFYYGGYSYVLTAASRNGETPEMKRFFDSVLFNKTKFTADQTSAIAFSKMNFTSLEIEESMPENKPDENKLNPVKTDEKQDSSPLIIFSKPLPSYTTQARQNNVSGSIRIRVTFLGNGRIGKLTLLDTLPDGLIRQAVFTALRTKFLPQESNGKPISVVKTVIYSFDIY
ncbi:MAG: energy transducer TonB [Pyrinomonadaceae bacterium]